MATYRIDVPATGGTITAATRASDCVNNISIDTSADAPGIISSTGITGNDITITYNTNGTSSARSCVCPISAMTTSGPCIGDSIQLIQAGSPQSSITINLTVWASGKYTDTTTLMFDDGWSQSLTYPSTFGGYSGTISLDSYNSGTITGASVADSVVSHMGWLAHLVSGSDTSLFDGAHIKVEV